MISEKIKYQVLKKIVYSPPEFRIFPERKVINAECLNTLVGNKVKAMSPEIKKASPPLTEEKLLRFLKSNLTCYLNFL